jgi:hypothetical protein
LQLPALGYAMCSLRYKCTTPPNSKIQDATLCGSHLCLPLTIQYFKADMAGAYRLMYLPVFLVFIVGLMRFWF